MKLPFRFTSILVAVFFLVLPATPAVMVVVEQQGSYQFIAAESIQVNARDRVRLCSSASNTNAKAINQCPAQKLSLIPQIRRDFSASQMVLMIPGASQFVFPDGLKDLSESQSPWSQAQFSTAAAGQKQPTPLPPGDVVVILNGSEPDAALAEFLSSESNFNLPAGRNASLQLQGKLIAAALKSLPNSAPIGRIRIQAEASLRAAVDRVSTGLVEAKDMEETRRRVAISSQIYPSDAAQKELRDRFAALELKLHQTNSILKTLAVGSQWDAYLALYKTFQRYEFLFPEIQETFRKALESSRDFHKSAAQSRLALKDCGAALNHLRIALRRDPTDLAAREQAESARVCLVRSPKNTRRSASLGAIPDSAPAMRTHDFVMRFIQEGKLELAEKSLLQGLKLYPDFPPLRLDEARLLEKRHKFRDALTVLDKYDSLVSSPPEWDEGDKARRDMEFQILRDRDERTTKLAALLKANRFGSAAELVKQGLASDSEDQDLLFRAAILALMFRQPVESKTFLTQYLEASQSLSGSPERRRQAFAILNSLELVKADPSPRGTPHWFSKVPTPEGIFYDPVSLTFVSRVDKIQASQKQSTEFRWTGDQIDSIQTFAEDKPPRLLSRLRFIYDPASGAVSRLLDATNETPAQTEAATNAPLKRESTIFDEPIVANSKPAVQTEKAAPDIIDSLSGPGLPVLLSSHPKLDIAAIEKMTGTQLGHTVAGNRFFHPFAWDKPSVFRISYDETGRAAFAYPAGPRPPAEVYEFTWSGRLLQQIALYPQLTSGAPDKSKLLYRRTLTYSGGKLMSEKIEGSTGKPSSIEYKYQGQQLVAAECNEDATLDGRSRKVVFLAR